MPNPAPGNPTDRSPGAPAPTPLTSCSLVVVRIQGAVNLGLIARLASNLGITDLRLVSPQCQVQDRQAQVFATSWGNQVLSTASSHPDLESATRDCGVVIGTSGEFHAGELGPPLPPQAVPEVLRERAAARWALVFGGEADGLTTRELNWCQQWLHLETFGENRSYNLTHAIAICGYLLASQAVSEASAWRQEPASRGQLRRFEERLAQVLTRAGHPPLSEERYRRRLHRLIGTLPLSDPEVHAALGMLTTIERALDGRASPP
jgi:TrmH family RNA methyltransferase